MVMLITALAGVFAVLPGKEGGREGTREVLLASDVEAEGEERKR
jgi:hypothetical protein